jgi:hypothetical protein
VNQEKYIKDETKNEIIEALVIIGINKATIPKINRPIIPDQLQDRM